MSSTDGWIRLKAYFEEAVTLPDEGRDAFVASIEDVALRDEVRSLLTAHHADSGFLEASIDLSVFYHDAVDSRRNDAPGDQIGPYTLLEPLGTGGMGAVYLAERTDGQFTHRVALKLARSDAQRHDLLPFLYHERQILASLQHPHIARLFDGGLTDDGRPYLAMEFVEGKPIDRYCADRNASLWERIDLFRAVCDAVQHAHQHLIVHRDLKPSNILVDADGHVKLLDFGIAKLLDKGLTHPNPITRPGIRLMTLEYASPEQVRGLPVSTASDLYSLGVLLYELLAGVRPYNLASLSPAEVEVAICEQEPPAPSVHPGTSDQYRKVLRGDLDTIVMKALRKAPERRYATADHLGEDLLRYTRQLPISARPDTVWYRAKTFLRRHRTAALLAALALTALVFGLILTLGLAREADRARARAERRFDDVRTLANTMLFDFHDAIRDLPGATPARRLLVANARLYLDSLLRDSGSDPTLRLELAEAHQRVGEIEGDPHYPNLGDLGAATRSYRAAVRILEDRWRDSPGNLDAQRALANALGRLAVVLSWGGANNDAIQHSERALALLRPTRTDSTSRRDYGRIQSELGWWLIWAGRTPDGLTHLDSAETTLMRVFHDRPDDVSLAIDVWRVYSYRSDGLAWSGAGAQALRLLSETGCPFLESLDRRFPDHPRILSSWRACVHKLGNLYAEAGRPRDALSYYEQSLALAEALARADSTNIHGHRGLAFVHESLGGVYRSVGQLDSALLHFEQALAIKARIYVRDTSHAEAGNTLANTHRSLCTLFARSDRPERGLAHCDAALAILKATTAGDPGNLIGRESLAATYVEAARLQGALAKIRDTPRHTAAAIALYDLALDEMRRLRAEAIGVALSVDPDSIMKERMAAQP
jgi:non-specific serine/threonine protein kinase/serine/threonine-protein kinase